MNTTGSSLQRVSASDEPVGSLMVETDDEVCAQHMAHAWGEKRGRKPFVSVEISQGTRDAPEADAETDETRRLASLDARDFEVTKHVIPLFAMGRLLLHQSWLSGNAMKQVTVHTYRQDTYYPRVVRAVATILSRSDVVAQVDVLLEMGNLTQKNHEAWYRGHVPYLERVFAGSLSKANRILRLIGFHVHDLNMIPRRTVYYQRGNSKNRRLRFSKSGHVGVEEAYATHYVWNQSQEQKRQVIARSMPAQSHEA